MARAVEGRSWGGTDADLGLLVNPEAITELVVFDTWTLNCDRHPPDLAVRHPNPDNVFVSTEGVLEGRLRLLAMDHTHCFTCGRDLRPSMADIDKVKDERVYGLFPAFVPYLRPETLEVTRNRLREFERLTIRGILKTLPAEWQVPPAAIPAWEDLLCQRAAFVAEVMMERLIGLCPP